MMMDRIRFTHRRLSGLSFYPLALSTALCLVLIIGRVLRSGTPHYEFLVWNLILAWAPYGFAVWFLGTTQPTNCTCAASASPPSRMRPAILGLLWLLFLPNAFYIMTDFNHILRRRDFPIMYDIVMIFAFAWTGLLLGVTSLYLMQKQVRAAWGRWAAAAFVLAATTLSGAGVYLGRFLRWNSWDVITHPRRLLGTLYDGIINPLEHTYALGHMAVFAMVALLCHLTFLSLRNDARDGGHHPATGHAE